MGHYEGKKRRAIGDQKETNGGNNDKKTGGNKEYMVYYKPKTKSYVHKRLGGGFK